MMNFQKGRKYFSRSAHSIVFFVETVSTPKGLAYVFEDIADVRILRTQAQAEKDIVDYATYKTAR